VAGKDYPQWDMDRRLSVKVSRDQHSRDDAHGFLRVIAAMSQAVKCRGNQLQLPE
jgi:hypothetical protein